ncbi:hypothetical protein Y032_0015g2635 [Ancylostoma ceylanicum]|nr:fatty acid and retinol binding protein [Ancylostoma ceylanicum]EYC23405.1 hypothetical protein Y032_0015g2635 [Ancylostoma ceylanicum]
MLRLALFAVLFACAFSAPNVEVHKFEDIPEQYRELIPKEVADHIKAITEEEKAILKEVLKEYTKYKDEEEYLAALKQKSPSLHEKAKKFHDFIKAKVDALGDEAKAFVKKVIAAARKLHAELLAGNKPSLEELKNTVKKYMAEFEALSAAAKEDLKKHFPILTSVFTNEKAKAMIDKHLQN